MTGDPFKFGDPLDDVLGRDTVPELSGDFADRVVAATQGRSRPLPAARSAPTARWRSGRRLVVGAVAAVALGSAAAATGLLDDLPIEIPSPEEVWSSLTGNEPAPDNDPVPTAEPASSIDDSDEPVRIEGAIDTSEELEEAFRQVDEVRETRRDTRREAVDQRIDNAIERRRARGLPAPTPEEEARLRGRIETMRERTDERIESRLGERRETLREEIEQGAEFTQEELIDRQRGVGSDTPVADRFDRLRRMPREERREAVRRWRGGGGNRATPTETPSSNQQIDQTDSPVRIIDARPDLADDADLDSESR